MCLEIARNGSGRFGTISKKILKIAGNGLGRFATICKHAEAGNYAKLFETIWNYLRLCEAKSGSGQRNAYK